MPSPKSETIFEILKLAIANHPKDCIFMDNAVEGALAYYLANQSTDELLDDLVEAIQSQELYCPHEGIDKRKETA